jgi:hypothetical protein
MITASRYCVVRSRYYPCQTCLPQVHCTVSEGIFFVNCRLQMGQGLVITYVITLFSLRAKPSKNHARRVPEELSLLRPTRPRVVGAGGGRLHNSNMQRRLRPSAPPWHYALIELGMRPMPLVGLVFAI